ncbi:MAG: hypothetical protein NVS3B5_21450 [Sphingomicrobium sp.]
MTSLLSGGDPEFADAVEVAGLHALIDSDEQPPVVDLQLRAHGQVYHAAILAVHAEWAVKIRSDSGEPIPSDGEFFPTQSAAVLAALLIVHQCAFGTFPDNL